jgi:hypothetical protein
MTMNITAIKRAVDDGQNVKWSSDIYDVVRSKFGEYLIVCQTNGSTIGLHGKEEYESHLNGDEDEFYVQPEGVER